ncbi:MAG: hypothetical protein ACK5LO_06485 [Leucobacter sp.]
MNLKNTTLGNGVLSTKVFAAIGAFGIVVLALTGCSSGSDSGDAAEAAQQSEQQAPSDQQSRQPMGVSGKITVANDGLLQVQSSDSQTAVSYTDDTAITQQVEGSLADVSVGSCITGIGEGGSEESGDSATALTTVKITEAVDGECSLGPGGGMGGRGMGGGAPEGFEPPADGEMPEPPADGEAPEGFEPPADGEMPEGMPESGFGGFTSGKVTGVSGSTITVDAVSMDGESSSKEVTVDDSTAFTKTADATSDALAVGMCVVATGEYSGEEYAATSIAVSEAGDDGCDTGFGGGFPGRGGSAGGSNGGSNE